jgi:4-amino-4-deoxy-L-arabinose transferase-like glycosyltransferase
MNRTHHGKEFTILKWIVFPCTSLILAAVIAWFNLVTFPLADGLPYVAVVALICGFSIAITKYTSSQNSGLARAAFIFEICLTAVLIANAAYSLSVQRKMAVAKMAETSQQNQIEQIGKLKGSRTQREALKKLEKTESAQTVFSDVESVLFTIMIVELALYALAAFTLLAVAQLQSKSKAPRRRSRKTLKAQPKSKSKTQRKRSHKPLKAQPKSKSKTQRKRSGKQRKPSVI